MSRGVLFLFYVFVAGPEIVHVALLCMFTSRRRLSAMLQWRLPNGVPRALSVFILCALWTELLVLLCCG
jgi:hypothetical protein